MSDFTSFFVGCARPDECAESLKKTGIDLTLPNASDKIKSLIALGCRPLKWNGENVVSCIDFKLIREDSEVELEKK